MFAGFLSFSSSVAIVLVRCLSTYRDQEQEQEQQQQWQSSLPLPPIPFLLVASLIDKFSIKVIFKCRKTQDRSLPGSGEDMEEGERRGTSASLCQDNVLVMPDKVINSYVLAARVASSFHASCPSN